jgi:TRAP-type C4-dicarboxylate transport system permease small subunit
MFMKLLLTALVIAGAIFAIRLRNRSAEVDVQAQRLSPPVIAGTRRLPWVFAYSFLLLALVGTGIYLFLAWRDASQVVDVRVIDSRSGREVVYQAYRGDVGERSFETTDGRRVSLAEVERLELGGR